MVLEIPAAVSPVRPTIPVRVLVVAIAAVATVLSGAPRLAGQIPPFGGAAAYVADLAARRAAVMEAIGDDAVLVLWSAPPRVYSGDTNYEYRQESNLFYLTGLEQPDSILVLAPGLREAPEHLFVRAVEPVRELWEGRTLRPAEVVEQTGIVAVHPETRTEAFDAFVDRLLSGPSRPSRLFVIGLGAAATGGDEGDPDEAAHVRWARAMAAAHQGIELADAGALLARQRMVKTPYEQALLRRSVEISAAAHVEAMRVTRPGRWEYQVEATLENAFRQQGALSWGYPSIVASGPNATILHYETSTRQLADGDLLLVDAAGSFQGMTGDITRTYPVNGRFTREQRQIYDLVLAAQQAGIAAARPGGRASDIDRAIRKVFGAGLLELGLVTDSRAATGESEQISYWFPHGPTHGIGVDVHDPLDALVVGAAFVIEPGLYIRPDVLERLEASPETRAIAQRLRPAVERYKNIGVRIEDDFLMTSAGPEILSAAAPKQPEELERVVGVAR